jgi:hypothetical protein
MNQGGDGPGARSGTVTTASSGLSAPPYPGTDIPSVDAVEQLVLQATMPTPPAALLPGLAPALPPTLRSVRQGCYLLRFIPLGPFPTPPPFVHYDGTLRVELLGGAHWSGDLYQHTLLHGPEPSPAGGIPSLPIARYRYYLSGQPLSPVTSGALNLSFERHLFTHVTRTWTNQGTFTATLVWVGAPAGFPDTSQYLIGLVKDPMGVIVGILTMGWVSASLRRATVEIDRLGVSEAPLANAAGTENWATVFTKSLWEMTAVESDSNLVEPSGPSWSDAELHAQLLASRDNNDLDANWRYVVLATQLLDSTERGIMFDAFATDSNNVPREGAAIASHWMIPNDPQWGTTAGQRFGAAADPYFRTAVHEIGHALNLIHEEDEGIAGTTFMTTTPTIVNQPGPPPFPDRITWDFHPTNKHRIKHWPDIYVRPGGMPWNSAHATTPIAADDAALDAEGIVVEVLAIRSRFPIGAPVRLEVKATNRGAEPVQFPARFRYHGGHIEGLVTAPGGTPKPFRSIVRCIEDGDNTPLGPGESRVAGLTLLRGPEGPLFATSGSHKVDVLVRWSGEGNVPLRGHGETTVWIDQAAEDEHANAAARVLGTPDLSVVVALRGGEHLRDGIEALETALHTTRLRPHYAATEALRAGRPFFDRAPNTEGLVDALREDVVATVDEIEEAARLLQQHRDEAGPPVAPAVESLRAAARDSADEARIVDMLDRLQ